MDNEVSVVGRLTSEPELRFVGEGVPMTTFRLLQTPRVKSGNQWVDGEARGFDCTCWRTLAEKAALLPTGLLVRVTGELVEDKWKDKDTGANRSKHKIQAVSIGIELVVLRDIEHDGKGSMTVVFKGDRDAPAHGSARPVAVTQSEIPYGEEPF